MYAIEDIHLYICVHIYINYFLFLDCFKQEGKPGPYYSILTRSGITSIILDTFISYSFGVLIHVSLITNGAEHFSTC